MAWNEPGGGKRDPWQQKPRQPDMDALLKRLREGLGRIFGGNGGGGGTTGGGNFGSVALVPLDAPAAMGTPARLVKTMSLLDFPQL